MVVVPGEVALARPLDLDDASAEVSQVPGGERTGDGLFEGDDGDAGQGECGVHVGRTHDFASSARTRPPPTMRRWISLVPS